MTLTSTPPLWHAPRQRRRYTYFVWPYGHQQARAACASLSSAMFEVVHAHTKGVSDLWIIRSDGYQVCIGCTACGHLLAEALRVSGQPMLQEYWCLACWKKPGRPGLHRRLSSLQKRLLQWLHEEARQKRLATASRYRTLVKAFDADKSNLSKSLRNLEEKHCVHRTVSPGGYSTSVQLTPLGAYLGDRLARKMVNEQR